MSYGSGDSHILLDVLPPSLCTEAAFELLCAEIDFREMQNKGGFVPRLISYQGEVGTGGCKPIYRVPTDDVISSTPFTPTVLRIKEAVELAAGQRFNHCLIQLYRSGRDYINEHADKTLDIARGSKIVNLSLGATREMRLFSKPDLCEAKETQRVRLPHNSLFVLGWTTNLQYLHAIKQDKRMDSLKSSDELIFGGRRISFTFRLISTFQRVDGSVFGQGAYCRTEDELDAALASGTYSTMRASSEEQSALLLKAFSEENRSCRFDWEGSYGRGFDIAQIRLTRDDGDDLR